MDPAVIYANRLYSRSNGRPLWVPESSVEIGDVGFVDINTGKFSRIMNVMRSPNDPLNSRGVPDGFVPLILDEEAEITHSYLNRGAICSASVKKNCVSGSLSVSTDGIGASGVRYNFSCSEDEGAVLLLEDDADKCYHLSQKAFKDYMNRWFESWCSFAEKRGYEIGDPDLKGPILVRGWIKTSSWGVAAWRKTSRSHDVQLHGEIGGHIEAGVAFSISEGSSHSIQYRCGPKGPQSEDTHASCPTTKRKRDQCIFISYFEIEKLPFCPRKIVASAESAHSFEDDEEPPCSSAPKSVVATGELPDPVTGDPSRTLEHPGSGLAKRDIRKILSNGMKFRQPDTHQRNSPTHFELSPAENRPKYLPKPWFLPHPNLFKSSSSVSGEIGNNDNDKSFLLPYSFTCGGTCDPDASFDLPEVDIVGTPHDSSYPIHRHICSDRVALSAFNSIRSTTALHQIPEIENVSTTTQPSEWSPSARHTARWKVDVICDVQGIQVYELIVNDLSNDSQRPPRGDTYSKDGHAKVLLELVEVEILLSTKVASFMSLFQVCQHSQSMFGEGEACRHKNILYLRPSENAVPIHSRFLPQENIPQCQNVITVIDDVHPTAKPRKYSSENEGKRCSRRKLNQSPPAIMMAGGET
ncbi:hypothetical protein NLI96_g2099 [Meripilus lineatus]|uniref:Uncharacterized protein n=1 Tax=Meripilus lineatus TaxID=2056292 RepID=A0AAD5VEQ9_9APHY|nr:hypothetical protein NLI96_g2099 [Physisporinus lineatus]